MPIRDEAINVFMGLPDDGPRLELTYNIGRDEPYEIGTGYGHIAISVDDLDATLERLAELGIEPERPPYTVREGGSRLCFVRDPDDYRIELLELAASNGALAYRDRPGLRRPLCVPTVVGELSPAGSGKHDSTSVEARRPSAN